LRLDGCREGRTQCMAGPASGTDETDPTDKARSQRKEQSKHRRCRPRANCYRQRVLGHCRPRKSSSKLLSPACVGIWESAVLPGVSFAAWKKQDVVKPGPVCSEVFAGLIPGCSEELCIIYSTAKGLPDDDGMRLDPTLSPEPLCTREIGPRQ